MKRKALLNFVAAESCPGSPSPAQVAASHHGLHGSGFLARVGGGSCSTACVVRKDLLCGGHGRASHPRGAGAAGAVLRGRGAHGSHRWRSQLGSGQSGGQRRFKGGHHLRGGAAAAPQGRVRVSDHDGV